MAGKTRRAWGQIRKLPSGNYRAEYTGPDGDRHSAPITLRIRLPARSALRAGWPTNGG